MIGNRLLILNRFKERDDKNRVPQKDLPLLEVEVIDKITDIRVVTSPSEFTKHIPVTKYLVCDKDRNVFSIYTGQIQKII